MTNSDREAQQLISIKDSIRMLDEQFEHLRNVQWNTKEDEEFESSSLFDELTQGESENE